MLDLEESPPPFKKKRRRKRRADLSPEQKAARNRANYRRRSRKREAKAMGFGSLARNIVARAIIASDDPAERKERVLIAREEGLFTDQEVADWLRIIEAKGA